MDRITKIERIVAPAMKTAAAFGLIPQMVDEATYQRHWNAMEEVVDQTRAPLEDEIVALRADLAVAHARAERMRAAIERYLSLESDCEYVEGAPAICPGIEQNGGPCHWCELRAALED